MAKQSVLLGGRGSGADPKTKLNMVSELDTMFKIIQQKVKPMSKLGNWKSKEYWQ